MAAHKPFKTKQLSFSFTLLLLFILFFTLIYTRDACDGFKTATSYPKNARTPHPKWFDLVEREIGQGRIINMGMVNIDGMTGKFHSKVRLVKVQFDKLANDVGWSDLFPAWINEELATSTSCKDIPMPRFEDVKELDVVVARVPCKLDQDHGMRDVSRLQLNLVVANLLVKSGRKGRDVFAVFVDSCSPMWEIFRCDDVLWHEGKSWVFRPELERLKEKVLMPVGACQLVPPFAQSSEEELRRRQTRHAYVTVLHSSESYVCGAIALAQSIILTNSSKDLVLLADEHILENSLSALRLAGWTIKPIQRIRSPFSRKYTYNEWNYSKLRIWQLQEYDKVMFIDADFIVMRNLDHFFAYPQLSAAVNDHHLFNSGLMLIEPSNCTFEKMMAKKSVVASYNGGDQGFLNEMFTWWHRLPKKINYLKYFSHGSGEDRARRVVPEDVYAVHYVGLKPWMCYREYDCNWDGTQYREFASDSANEKWWRIYDAMPVNLRPYCSLTAEMELRIQKRRNEAKNSSLGDEHWKMEVQDSKRRRD